MHINSPFAHLPITSDPSSLGKILRPSKNLLPFLYNCLTFSLRQYGVGELIQIIPIQWFRVIMYSCAGRVLNKDATSKTFTSQML